jgi:multiple sugar transport system permease protein
VTSTAAATRPPAVPSQRPAPRAPRDRGVWARRAGMGAILLAVCVFTLLPFWAMVAVALAPPGPISLPGALFPTDISFASFTRVLTSANVPRWTFNSFVYSAVSVVFVLLFASMAGYAFAKKRFRGNTVIFWSFLATIMIPLQVNLIPYFILIASLGGVNTFWGLIVPTLANSQAVFLCRQFILGLPEELFEAARVDGASDWRIYWQIVLPLIRPVLATAGIFVFLWHWNDFLWPLVVAQSDSMRTLTVGLATLESQTVPLGQVMAGATISVVPCILVFVLLQRYLVNSIASTGLKG